MKPDKSHFLIWLYLILIFNISKARLENCSDWTEKHVFRTNERPFFNITPHVIIFEDFEQFSNIESCKHRIKTVYLKLFPAYEYLLVNSNLNITQLFAIFDVVKTTIFFYKLKGFNQNFRTLPLRYYLKSNDIRIYDSYFDFFLNGTTLIDEHLCSLEHFDSNYTNFFGSMTRISFAENTLYSKRVCPYVFMNTNLIMIVLQQITNSLIFKNQLEFLNVNSTADLNTHHLSFVVLYLAYEELSLKILNKQVFRHIRYLALNGFIHGIEEDLFANFVDLQYVSLSIENLRKFLHLFSLKWLNSINKYINVDFYVKQENLLNQVKIVKFNECVSIFLKSYDYPDEDICLFQHFPHNQLVYPSIMLENEIPSCSCTIIWLIQHSDIYLTSDYSEYAFKTVSFNLSRFKTQIAISCLSGHDLSRRIHACNFPDRFNKCHVMVNTRHLIKMSELDISFYFKWIQYIIAVFVKPILLLTGIVSNFAVILVLKNKLKRKILSNLMYKHIFANAVFNLIFCAIHSFSLINVCIFPRTSFCSQVFRTAFSQIFKIYGILFIGNVIRLCCNVSYLTFSVSRFFVSTLTIKSTCFKRFEKTKLLGYYSFILVISLGLNTFKILEYRQNFLYNTFENEFPVNVYDIEYCSNQNLDTALIHYKCKMFAGLNICINVLNNVVFLVVGIFVDILLFNYTKKNLQRKETLFHDSEKLSQAIKLKEKVNKMVIANGSLYFVSHFPEFCVTIVLLVFNKKIASFCYHSISCTDLIEITQVSGLISVGLQIFIFIKFDRNFAESISDLKTRLILCFITT